MWVLAKRVDLELLQRKSLDGTDCRSSDSINYSFFTVGIFFTNIGQFLSSHIILSANFNAEKIMVASPQSFSGEKLFLLANKPIDLEQPIASKFLPKSCTEKKLFWCDWQVSKVYNILHQMRQQRIIPTLYTQPQIARCYNIQRVAATLFLQ